MTVSEPRELAALVLDRLAPHLSEIAWSDGRRTRDTPVHRLHALVAERLTALDEQEALADLTRDPRNNSLVRRLLASAATEDPGYASALAAAVAALPAATSPEAASPGAATSEAASPGAGPSDGPDTGPGRDGVAGTHGATGSDTDRARPAPAAAPEWAGRPPTAAPGQRDDLTAPGEPAEVRRGRRRGLLIGLCALVVLALAAVLTVRSVLDGLSGAGGLDSESTCTQYRQAPLEERVAAIRQIALAKGVSGVDGPLLMSALNQLCDTQPDARLGDLIGRLR